MLKLYTYARLMLATLLLPISISTFGQSGVVSTMRTSPRGIVSFSGTFVLTGIGDTKYIDGYVKKYGSEPFIFPVGDNGSYGPFSAAADGTEGAYYKENPDATPLPPGGPFSINVRESTLAQISNVEFWDVDGTNTTRLTFSWNLASNVSILTNNDLTKLTITGWNTQSGKWEKIASKIDLTALTGGASTLEKGSITTELALAPNTYNVYSLAATTTTPLPVTLLNFVASSSDNENVLLVWSTTSETNSQEFDIENSQDGKFWNLKGTVQAKGESSATAVYNFEDKTPFPGVNLYRLKMLDVDGTFSFSHMRNVTLRSDSQTAFYPNPVSDKLYVKTANLSNVKEIQIYGVSGAKVFSAQSASPTGIDVKGLKAGIYLIKMTLANGVSESQKIIVIN